MKIRSLLIASMVVLRDKNHIAFVEDAGDTLHGQRSALDSGWLFDVALDYSNPANKPVRILAQGRDPSATIDSGLQGTPGFQNDGDGRSSVPPATATTTTMTAVTEATALNRRFPAPPFD